jgi:tetratricopeptide (TPR) repeat protein
MPTGFYFGNIDSNNEFSISFLAKAGINFKIEGKYDATAYYSDSKKIVYFDFVESLDDEIFETETIEEPIPTETIEDNLIIIKQSQIKADIQDDVLQETKIKNDINDKKNNAVVQVSTNNLSVEDTDLGKLLNQITLNCDQNEYTDTISYYDGLGPALIRLCKFEEAILYFDKDIADDPLDVEILTNKGVTLSKLGHIEEAILYYDTTLEIDS